MKIRIKVGVLSMDADLADTPTARHIYQVLPLEAPFNTWGDEIYFTVPVDAELDETAAEEVEMGDLGYWPTGQAFCIFFGPTPMSRGSEIVPASAVNVIGRVIGDTRQFKEVMREEKIRVEPA